MVRRICILIFGVRGLRNIVRSVPKLAFTTPIYYEVPVPCVLQYWFGFLTNLTLPLLKVIKVNVLPSNSTHTDMKYIKEDMASYTIQKM